MKRLSISTIWLTFTMIMLALNGAAAQSPGDTIGYMQRDSQTWASIGNKIAIDHAGGVHMVWHEVYPADEDGTVKYVYIDSYGLRSYIDLGVGEYPTVATNSSNQPCVVFDHGDDWDMYYWNPDGFSLLPDMGMWPMVTFDRQDRIHIAYFWYGGGREGVRNIGYVRSDDNGQTWTEPVKVDSALTPSFVIAASPVSDKVAIAYSNNLFYGEPVGVSYIESVDGVNWNWQDGAIDITNYEYSPYVTGDDLDAVYDYNDNLHIVYNSQVCGEWECDDPVYIRHYDSASGQTSVVTILPPWNSGDCFLGHWSNTVCKMSIAATQDSVLLVSYTRFSPKDCSDQHQANGEICLKYSYTDGQSWTEPFNLTNSASPGCVTDSCNSDHWCSMAEHTNAYAHLFYVNDKDGGDRDYGEGYSTINPMLYLRVPLEDEGTNSEDNTLPTGIALNQNYPNPFNAQTAISFYLPEHSDVTFYIYDLLGRQVETLRYDDFDAGEHTITWDGGKYASGIYLYRLQAGQRSAVGRMMLEK
jgi:hypothetical protein